MLKIVDSTKFILTLQSSPPFVVENIFALALVILLAVPLIVNLQFCLDKSRRRNQTTTNTKTNGNNEKWNKIIRRRLGIVKSNTAESNIYENDDNHHHHDETVRSFRNSDERIRRRAVVMHYPAPIPIINSSSSSDYDLRFTSSNRRTVSTPNLCSNSTGDGPPSQYENYHNHNNNNNNIPSCDIEILNNIEDNQRIKLEKDEVPVERSSSFVVTNSEVPIIDISTFNYNAYRHKLIEANLKKHYKNNQPPGDVIFNSIHLNTIDSTLGIKLNEQYEHSFFDFVEEYYDATIGMSKKEMEFLHPLDHFLVKGLRQRETYEKGTETLNLSDKNTIDSGVVKDDNIDKKMISINRKVLDKNGNISRTSKVKNLSSSLSKRRKENSASVSKDGDERKEENESPTPTPIPTPLTTPGSIESRKDSKKMKKKKKNVEDRKGERVVGRSSLLDSNTIPTKIVTNSNVDQVQTRKYHSTCKPVNVNDTTNSPSKSKLLSSIVKADKDSINLSSLSSSEFGSTREVISNHSRDSSSIRSPSSAIKGQTRKFQPWITGNNSVSFNRKYGNNGSDISNKFKKRIIRSNERSSNFGSRPTTPRPRSANLTLTSKRKTKDIDNNNINNLNVVERKESFKGLKDYTVKGKGCSIPVEICSDFIESESFTLETPIATSTLPSSNSSRLLPKLLGGGGSFENDDSMKFTFENVSDGNYSKFNENQRDRRHLESNRKIISSNKTDNNINNKGRNNKINTNSRKKKSNYSIKSYETTVNENLTTKSNNLGEQMGKDINKIECKNESIPRRKKYNNNNREKVRKDVILNKETKKFGELSNLSNKNVENVEFSHGNKSDRFSVTKTDDTSSPSVILQSRDTLVLDKNDSRIEKHRTYEKKLDKLSELRSKGNADSNVCLNVQTGLKNYIKTLKELLKNEGNLDSVDLASLSLKDAISPELESILSVSELKELQDLLNLSEIKSNLTNKNVT